ncbi:MAG: hypothetical protein ACTSXD_09825 [Candidatus Heimdallarchaeaceae archaeon]
MIENYNITTTENYGISLSYSGFGIIKRNICNCITFGIYVKHFPSTSIEDNTCIDNSSVGMLIYSNFITLNNNTCKLSSSGLTNLEEYTNETDSNDDDTDSDGMPNG